MNESTDRNRERTVQKDLDDADRTDGYTVEHYSHEQVAEACHAEEGQRP